MKKKILAGLGAVALAFTLSTGALAHHHALAIERLCNGLQAACGRFDCSYVDADGDGVCDNFGAGNCLHGNGGYVDSNGDGVCDNYDPDVCPGDGTGWGGGYGGGHHGGGCGNGNGNGWGYGGGQGHHGGGHCW